MPATFNIPEHIQTILRDATIFIPDKPSPANLYTLKLNGQLSRKDYLDVMKVIEGAGGVWDKKKGLHTFRRDPSTVLELAQTEGKGVNLQQQFQSFYTPAPVADRMVEMLGIPPDYTGPHSYESGFTFKVLEPSCGEGALVRAVRRANAHVHIAAYDIDQVAIKRCGLGALGHGIGGPVDPPEIAHGYCVLKDFMDVHPPVEPKDHFDRIVMNPPFTKGQDAEHVIRALKFLKPGGRLVAIVSPNALDKETGHYKTLRDLMASDSYHLVESRPLPAKTFKDTDIETLIVSIVRMK